MSDSEWGPVIEHDGKSVPLPDGTICWIECAAGVSDVLRVETAIPPGGNCWVWDSIVLESWIPARIVRYRVRKPRALLDLIELVENLPAPATPKVDA